MRRVISQREARRLQKRVAELETRERTNYNRWSQEYPSGEGVCDVELTDVSVAICQTAWKLGFVLVAKPTRGNDVRFFAVKP